MLIVEDGTGLQDADAYVDIADVALYASRFGLSFDGEEEKLEQSIRQATAYIDNMFTFLEEKLTEDQALEFPRTNFGLPRQLKDACSELAIIATTEPLISNIAGGLSDKQSVAISGAVSVTYVKSMAGRDDGQKRFVKAERLLSKFIQSDMTIPVLRA